MILADTLPGDTSTGYVAAAYLVFLALLLIYVAIMGVRVARMERDLTELDDLVREQKAAEAAREEREVLGVATAEPGGSMEGMRSLSPEPGPRGGS